MIRIRLFFDEWFWCAYKKKHLLEFKEMYEIVQKRTDVPHLQIYFQRICSWFMVVKSFILYHINMINRFSICQLRHRFVKQKSISISYHGGLQFGRNIDILIDWCLCWLIKTDSCAWANQKWFFVWRVQNERLREKYKLYSTYFRWVGLFKFSKWTNGRNWLFYS
jgi:hypothetical protein